MVNKVLQPQEIEVFYVLPAVRKELAVCLKAQGKTQTEIAGLLGVTGAAVSQYMSSKRASIVTFDPKLKSRFEESARRIDGEMSMVRETQQLLKVLRDERVICKMHAELGQVPEGCKVCFE